MPSQSTMLNDNTVPSARPQTKKKDDDGGYEKIEGPRADGRTCFRARSRLISFTDESIKGWRTAHDGHDLFHPTTRPRRLATFDRFGAARDAELLEQCPRCVFDCAITDPELVGNFLVALAVGHQLQRRQLPRRELHARHALGELGGGRRGQ